MCEYKLSFSGLLSCHKVFRSELFAGTNLMHDGLRKGSDVVALGAGGESARGQIIQFPLVDISCPPLPFSKGIQV